MKISDTRHTPGWLKMRINELLGGSYMDPCPVGGTDGLRWQAWTSHVYVNPPGSLKKAFAQCFANWWQGPRSQQGVWMHYDWDHSTVAWRTVHSVRPVYVLFEKRIKMLGPGPDKQDRLHDVGRSQALAVVGVRIIDIQEAFEDIATIIAR